MNAYTEAAPSSEPPDTLTPAEIDVLFKRKPGWFNHNDVRKRLYAKGFPHPASPGRWSKAAVSRWMATAGENPAGKLPPAGSGTPRKRRPRARRPNAYVPAMRGQP